MASDNFIFPQVELCLVEEDGRTLVFDVLRRKNIVLTAEEWVRQHLVHYLINDKKYPKSLMVAEDGLKYAGLKKRSDVVVYKRSGDVLLLVECKSPRVKLHQKSMEQLSAYNQHYKADYLALTNGLSLMVYKMDYKLGSSLALHFLPDYE